MSSINNISGASKWSDTESQIPPPRLPPNAVELIELRSASIEHRLGYFRNDSFVIFGYCPGGGEVIWKDGHSSGFGTGGWKIYLQEIAPLAARRGTSIGDVTSVGTHVLLMDRINRVIYAAPRESAEEFLARIYGISAPNRRCLCSFMNCAACPVRSCPKAGSVCQPKFEGNGVSMSQKCG
jgi:hypothetical protein